MLGELRGQFPFGVLLITDEQSTEPIPDWSSEDQQVTRAVTAMVVKIRHEVDGPATVRIWDEQPSRAGVTDAEEVLTVRSGVLRVSTATGAHFVRIQVPKGPVLIRVIASAPRNPEEIDLVIRPRARSRVRNAWTTLPAKPT